MPQLIRKWPLTTLLLAAIVCIDLIVCRGKPHEADLHGVLAFSLYFGQIGLLSAWLALGRTARWIRFLVWIGALALTYVFSADFENPHTNFVLAISYAAAVVISTLAAGPWISSHQLAASREPARWQFSLLGLLVVMTLVAVVASIARFSDLPLVASVSIATFFGSIALIPAAALMLLKSRPAPWIRFMGLLGLATVWGFLIVIAVSFLGEHTALAFDAAAVYPLQALVIGIGIIVVDHDLSRQQTTLAPP